MKRTVCVLLIVLASLGFARGQVPAAPTTLALTNITVIDATGAAAMQRMTVVIAGDTIAAIGSSVDVHPPKDAHVVDATGTFLIPGLWDMHVHWYDERYLPLFTANGVTGVRQMWGMPMHHEWRRQQQAGSLLGPRQSIASTIVDGPTPFWRGSIAVGNAAEARAAVDAAKKSGADFVKVYQYLPRDAYFAIADEAKTRGIAFAGHVPYSVRVTEASDAGQKCIEHLTGVLLQASSQEDRLRKELSDAASMAAPVAAVGAASARQSSELIATYDQKKAEDIFAHLVRNQTWQCPTLTVLRNMASLDEPGFATDPRLKYVPPSVRAQWSQIRDARLQTPMPEAWAIRKKLYERQAQLVAPMRRAGVEFLAGTDVANPFCFPGFSLHDELALLVKAGLTPMEALQAATRNPARYLGLLASLGTVEKGKIADLVILEANPLDDIHNTTRISGVIAGGRYFPKAALDGMLAQIEKLQ